jgi:hypothetical protein
MSKRTSFHADVHKNGIGAGAPGRSAPVVDDDDDADQPPPPITPSDSEIGLILPARRAARGAPVRLSSSGAAKPAAPKPAQIAPPSPQVDSDDDNPPPPPAPSESDMVLVLPSRAAVAAAAAISARRAPPAAAGVVSARLQQPPPPAAQQPPPPPYMPMNGDDAAVANGADDDDDDNPPPPPAPSESDMALNIPARRVNVAVTPLNGSGRVAKPQPPVDDRPPPPAGAPMSPVVARGPRREVIAAARTAQAAPPPPAASLAPPPPAAAAVAAAMASPVRGPRRLVRREGHMANHLDVAVTESRRSTSANDPPPPPPPTAGADDVLAALDDVATADAPRLSSAAKDRARGAGNRRRPTRKGRSATGGADTGMQVSDDAPAEVIVLDAPVAGLAGGAAPRNKALDRSRSGRRASFHIKSDGKASDAPAEGVARAPSIKRLSGEFAPSAIAAALAGTAGQPAPPKDISGRGPTRVARGPMGPTGLANSGRRGPPGAAPMQQQQQQQQPPAPTAAPVVPKVVVPTVAVVTAAAPTTAAAAPVAAAAPPSPREWTPGSGQPKWKLCRTKEGRVYYFDRETKKSVWVRPDDFDGDEKGAPTTTTTTTTTTATTTTSATVSATGTALNGSARKPTNATPPVSVVPPATTASPPPAAPTALNSSGRKAAVVAPSTTAAAPLNGSGRKPTVTTNAYSGALGGDASKHHDHKEDLRVHDWYHGAISAQQAFELLKEHVVSTFLVRTSSREGCFTVSWVQSTTTVVHTICTHDEKGWHIEARGEERVWPSIGQMLHDYRQTMAIGLKRQA